MEFFDEDPSDYSDHLTIRQEGGRGQISESEINQLEKLFISKLTEKYRLIDRDLKKG